MEQRLSDLDDLIGDDDNEELTQSWYLLDDGPNLTDRDWAIMQVILLATTLIMLLIWGWQ